MPQASDDIDDDKLARLVSLFYGRVRADPELGPIFNDAVEDWPAHLAHLTDFWHAVMLGSGRFKGRPMMKHMQHQARIRSEHFDRWLALWDEATNELMVPENATALQRKARHIGESFKAGLFYRPEDDDPALREPPR